MRCCTLTSGGAPAARGRSLNTFTHPTGSGGPAWQAVEGQRRLRAVEVDERQWEVEERQWEVGDMQWKVKERQWEVGERQWTGRVGGQGNGSGKAV